LEIEFADVVKVSGLPLVQTCDPSEVVRLHLGDVVLMGAVTSRGVPRSTKDANGRTVYMATHLLVAVEVTEIPFSRGVDDDGYPLGDYVGILLGPGEMSPEGRAHAVMNLHAADKDGNVERVPWGVRVSFTARNVYAIERRKEED